MNNLSGFLGLVLDNKYLKIYLDLCLSRQRLNRMKGGEEYYERHHIWPKCKAFGGSNDEWNLVLLTAKEHFVAHKLLVRICQIGSAQRQAMNFALLRMVGNDSYKKIKTSRLFEIEKLRISSEPLTDEFRYACGNGVRGKPRPKGAIEAQRQKMIGNKNALGKRQKSIAHKCKSYAFISPEGILYEGINLRHFCREAGLNQTSMQQILRKGKIIKGWRRAEPFEIDSRTTQTPLTMSGKE